MPNTTAKDLALQKEAILKSLGITKSSIQRVSNNPQVLSNDNSNIIGSYYQNNIAPAQLESFVRKESITEQLKQLQKEEDNQQQEEITEIQQPKNEDTSQEQEQTQIVPETNIVKEHGQPTVIESSKTDNKQQENIAIQPPTKQQSQSQQFIPENIKKKIPDNAIPVAEIRQLREQNKNENIETQITPIQEKPISTSTETFQENKIQAKIGGSDVTQQNTNIQSSESLIAVISALNDKLDILLQLQRDTASKTLQFMTGYTKYLDNIQKAIENIDLTVDKPNGNLPFS